MSWFIKPLLASIAVASLGAQTNQNTVEKVSVSCSVSVDYLINSVVAESYRKDFVVQPGAGFSDDFSTSTRQKLFRASVAREGGNLAVAIEYFSDVSVFDSVDFNTRFTMHLGRGIQTTAGSHTFSSSQAGGNHTTNYVLACSRL